MDDFSILSLVESKNEWCARLVNIFTPAVIEGMQSIFTEAVNLCENDDESSQYLMTFQTFLKRIPNWNPEIIEKERRRIEDESGCNYLEDLVTCVHIVQLKALSCIRVSNTNKKVDIDVPSASRFIHKVYIKCAAKIYKNVYLYELEQEPLQVQKNNRELELLIREAILEAVRDTMPIEKLLKAYMAEQEAEVEHEAVPEGSVKLDSKDFRAEEELSKTPDIVKPANSNQLGVKKEPQKSLNFTLPISKTPDIVTSQEKPLEKLTIPGTETLGPPQSDLKLKFDNLDYTLSERGEKKTEVVPKDIARLEKISEERNTQRKLEEAAEDDDLSLKIGEEVKLEIEELNSLESKKKDAPKLEIETLM